MHYFGEKIFWESCFEEKVGYKIWYPNWYPIWYQMTSFGTRFGTKSGTKYNALWKRLLRRLPPTSDTKNCPSRHTSRALIVCDPVRQAAGFGPAADKWCIACWKIEPCLQAQLFKELVENLQPPSMVTNDAFLYLDAAYLYSAASNRHPWDSNVTTNSALFKTACFHVEAVWGVGGQWRRSATWPWPWQVNPAISDVIE